MKHGQIKSLILPVVLLIGVILVSGCSTTTQSGVPKLTLKNGWSPIVKMKVNSVDTDVKCMTVEDVEGLRQYLILIQETGAK